MCETLPYYRSHQEACYHTGGFAKGFMFDKVPHHRDYTDSDVVISRAGGGQVKDERTGKLRNGVDQKADAATSLNLRNNMQHYNPVVIAVGSKNPHFPSQPPHRYCVMDFFKPTHIWSEKNEKKVVVRYRFEKLNLKKESWWRPEGPDEEVELGSLPPPIKQVCSECSATSEQVFLNGWMCLQTTCSQFWKIDDDGEAREPDDGSLIYDPRFLKQKTPWPNDDHEYPLIPNDPQLSAQALPGEDTSEAFSMGIVCPLCRRCISRLDWRGWNCANPSCTYQRHPPHTLISATSLRDPRWPLSSSYTLSRDNNASIIDVRVLFSHGYRINVYKIPDIPGFIAHMISNKTVVEEPEGPDDMFEELQKTDIGLKRHSMPQAQLQGPNHSKHFTINYGMPYKFIAAPSSFSFDGAPRMINDVRSRLIWAVRRLLSLLEGDDATANWTEFNEVLGLGYFEGQKIDYHDDGEAGLGPTIATVSIGASGTMCIRMKQRQHRGVSVGAKLYDDKPPKPGCEAYAQRLAMQPGLEALRRKDSKAWTARRREIPKELGLTASGNAKDVLKMVVGHGDIVVMHGAELQTYYEHEVEHTGKLRFAMTCRTINPVKLKGKFREGDVPDYEVGPDKGGYDGSGLL